MSQPIARAERLTFGPGGSRREPVELPLEAPLRIEVNGKHLATLMRLPGDDRELALGFWLTEGLIRSRVDVARVEHCPDDPNLLRMTLAGELPERRPMAIGTACGGILGAGLPEPLTGGPVARAADLMRMPAKLQRHQPVRERVGVVHGAGVFGADGELLAAYEDIGRHNAMDKAIGWCALGGERLDDKLLLITGRGSAEMLIKAARAGVRVLCTLANVTALGAELADVLGVTLVARLGDDHLEVFSHPKRVRE